MSAPDPNHLPPSEAGWFLNLATKQLRYFDGNQWTDHTAPPDGSLPERADGWMARPDEGAFRYFDGRYYTDLTRPLGQTPPGPAEVFAERVTYGQPRSPGKRPRSGWKTAGIALGAVVGGFVALGVIGAAFGAGSNGSEPTALSSGVGDPDSTGASDKATPSPTSQAGAPTTPMSTPAPQPTRWYPKGYKAFDADFAFRFPKKACGYHGRYDYSCTILVLPRSDCDSGLYVKATTYNSSGAAIGYTNDVSGSVEAGTLVRMDMSVLEDDASDVIVKDIHCMGL